MTTPANLRNKNAECSCGRAGCKGTRKLDIVIDKAHLRRAIVAANGVNDAARSGDAPDPGVVFMTALLLVERLATSCDCEPHALLAKMASSFELKRRHLAGRKDHH